MYMYKMRYEGTQGFFISQYERNKSLVV